MKSIYITGMSGTGKSSVIQHLSEKGFTAIDTDYGDWKELSLSGDTPEWLLKEEKIKKSVSKPLISPVFIAGCCSNQVNLYPFFDHILLLSSSIETILERVSTRTSNPYGQLPHERDEIIWNFENIQPLLQEGADFEFNTEVMTVEEIAASLEQLASPR
ncbi:AAA family ATPase [Chryseobacterium shigense]|uniref:Shikimate kinase n=1 Tax=Chryseobacterium shigense TaxID=297244 RepID=A0A841NP30_9FLAO|nr:AAA family ATPase [Chryseobacterium shigense]MBB6372485.1 shikimate kinase [Chryseobacterium shigense]